MGAAVAGTDRAAVGRRRASLTGRAAQMSERVGSGSRCRRAVGAPSAVGFSLDPEAVVDLGVVAFAEQG